MTQQAGQEGQSGQEVTPPGTGTTGSDQGAGGAAGAGAGAAGAAGAGGAGAAERWYASLPEKFRTDPNIVKYQTLDKFVEGHTNAVKRLGAKPEQLLVLPDKLDDPEAMGEIYNRLGRPATAAEYKADLADGASDQDKAAVDGFKAAAHAAGLNPGQFGAVLGYYNQMAEANAKAQQDADTAAAAATQATLRKDWGAKFDTYSKEIGDLLNKHGGPEVVDELNAKGLGNSVGLNKLLAWVVDQTAERETPGGGDGQAKIGGGTLTPDQAKAELRDLETNVALRDKHHPQHADVMARRRTLLAFAEGRSARAA